jgi:hypothetical protein
MEESLATSRPPAEAKARPGPARERKRKPPPRPQSVQTVSERGSAEARKVAATILEVLAGVRTPTDAAGAIGVSLPRYYALEIRAIEGLLGACERRPRGPRRSPEREVRRIRRELSRLEREAARSQALLRAAQRAVGLRSSEPQRGKPEAPGKRRRRRASPRALRAAKILRATPENSLEGAGEPKHNLGEVKT